MSKRTSLLLDEEAEEAARQLARRYDCSTSSAIRRAIVSHRDALVGIPREVRRKRVETLRRLVDLFTGHDAAEEISRLKSEDSGF